eukprot:GFYU01018568.1.p1 GENE.GFYU01018568.1~~GFYU01018568.1.p1  ORF type:complete len:141 (-),score=15.15 GFYU01018568.1:85-507(-)
MVLYIGSVVVKGAALVQRHWPIGAYYAAKYAAISHYGVPRIYRKACQITNRVVQDSTKQQLVRDSLKHAIRFPQDAAKTLRGPEVSQVVKEFARLHETTFIKSSLQTFVKSSLRQVLEGPVVPKGAHTPAAGSVRPTAAR